VDSPGRLEPDNYVHSLKSEASAAPAITISDLIYRVDPGAKKQWEQGLLARGTGDYLWEPRASQYDLFAQQLPRKSVDQASGNWARFYFCQQPYEPASGC